MKLLQRESLDIIERNKFGNLCLSLNHQPYAKYIKYNWDIDNGCVEIIINISEKDIIYKIINCNEKVAFLINECNCNCYNTILIQGKVCIIESNEKGKIELVIISEFINGNSYKYLI